MRKLSTFLSTLALAVVMTLSASAATSAKVTRNQASKAPHFTSEMLSQKHLPKLAGAATSLNAAQNQFSMAQNVKLQPRTSAANRQAIPLKADGLKAELFANVLYSESNSSLTPSIYTIPDLEPLAEEAYMDGSYGAVLCGDKYYVATLQTLAGIFIIANETRVYDAETWELLDYNPNADFNCFGFGMTYDEASGLIYGCFYNEAMSALEFGTLDPVTMTRTSTICGMYSNYLGMGVKADGTLIAMYPDGTLVSVDKTTGAETILSETGVTSQYLTSGVVDQKANTYYYLRCDPDVMDLYAIDLTTYEVSRVTNGLGIEATGLSIAAPSADDNAPAAVEGLDASFKNGSLTGRIDFTAPTTTFGGEALSGALTYKVYVNKEVVATGSTTAGSDESVDVTVEKADMYKIYVTCSNEAGEGPAGDKLKIWIGPDAPEAPADVELTRTGETNTVTWEPVEESVHNGYFVPEEVVYTVTRVLGAEKTVVAENIAACTFSEEIAEPEALCALYYTVTASFDGTESAAAASNSYILGKIIPPYAQTFDKVSDLDFFTVIDANGDGTTWTPYDGALRVQYNSAEDMDDWLITAAITLEAGKAYDISIDAWAYSSAFCPEAFEVMLGTAPTIKGMDIPVIERTELYSTTPATYTATITVAESGDYFLGIHGVSEPDMYYLYIDNLAISAPYSQQAPDVVTEVAIKGDYYGAPKAEVSFKAPTTNVLGEAITSIDKIEVYNHDEVVTTFENPAPGATLSFNAEAEEDGEEIYSIVASNEEGQGKTLNVSVYLGVNYAALPEDFKAIESVDNPGYVNLFWTGVAKDINGNDIDPSLITYIIQDAYGTIAEVPFAEDGEYGFQALAPGSAPTFGQWLICTSTKRGQGSQSLITWAALGEPLEMPFIESVANGGPQQSWMAAGSDMGWYVASACDVPACEPIDGDGGMLMVDANGIVNEPSTLSSLKVHVNESEFSSFGFYYFPTEGPSYEISPIVKLAGYTYKLDTFKSNEGTQGEWNQKIISLIDYVGQNVEVGFTVTCFNYDCALCIDDIEVREFAQTDLGIVSINAPRSVAVGSEGIIKAVVRNLGLDDVDNFAVKLLCNGEVAQTIDGQALKSGNQSTYLFTITADLFSDPEYTYQVAVECAGDEIADNNESINMVVRIAQSDLPAVEDLEAINATGTVKLEWTEPETEGAMTQYLDDVEEHETWAIDQAGDWTFIDVDASDTYGYNGYPTPIDYSPMAFAVIDVNEWGNPLGVTAHSGSKVFACFNATTGADDDWMISPELPGVAQTVSFWARSLTVQYGSEEFEFYYSTTSPAISDMIKVDAHHDVPDEWTEYTYDLPEGAKYFAIRCVSQDRFVFLLDDISFKMGKGDLTLVGYDIYRGTEKIAEGVAEPQYVDADVEDGAEYTYFVVTVYTTGESALSNPAVIKVDYSGINDAITEQGEVKYFNTQGLPVQNPQNGTFIRVQNGKATKVYINK